MDTRILSIMAAGLLASTPVGWARDAVDVAAVYTGEVWHVVGGDFDRDTAYLDKLDVRAHADLDVFRILRTSGGMR